MLPSTIAALQEGLDGRLRRGVAEQRRMASRAGARWLPRKDLNLDKQDQNLLCYRYTTGQDQPLQTAVRKDLRTTSITDDDRSPDPLRTTAASESGYPAWI